MGPRYANFFVDVKNEFSLTRTDQNLIFTNVASLMRRRYSNREELNQFITAVNSFHPALNYTWEISENSLVFLDIKLSVNGNGLLTSVHYKPTESLNCLLLSSSSASTTRKKCNSIVSICWIEVSL